MAITSPMRERRSLHAERSDVIDDKPCMDKSTNNHRSPPNEENPVGLGGMGKTKRIASKAGLGAGIGCDRLWVSDRLRLFLFL